MRIYGQIVEKNDFQMIPPNTQMPQIGVTFTYWLKKEFLRKYTFFQIMKFFLQNNDFNKAFIVL